MLDWSIKTINFIGNKKRPLFNGYDHKVLVLQAAQETEPKNTQYKNLPGTLTVRLTYYMGGSELLFFE